MPNLRISPFSNENRSPNETIPAVWFFLHPSTHLLVRANTHYSNNSPRSSITADWRHPRSQSHPQPTNPNHAEKCRILFLGWKWSNYSFGPDRVLLLSTEGCPLYSAIRWCYKIIRRHTFRCHPSSLYWWWYHAAFGKWLVSFFYSSTFLAELSLRLDQMMLWLIHLLASSQTKGLLMICLLNQMLHHLKLGCLLIMIHVCFYTLAHRIKTLNVLLSADVELKSKTLVWGCTTNLEFTNRKYFYWKLTYDLKSIC